MNEQNSLRGVAGDRNRGRIKSASDVPLRTVAGTAAAGAAAAAAAAIPSSPTKTRSILPDTNLLAQLLTGKNSVAASNSTILANDHTGASSGLPVIIPVQTIDHSGQGSGALISEKTMTLLPASFTPEYVKLPEGQRLLKNERSALQPVVSPKHNADEAASATGAVNKGSSSKSGTERVQYKVDIKGIFKNLFACVVLH